MNQLRVTWFQVLSTIAIAGSIYWIAGNWANRGGFTPSEKDRVSSQRVLTPTEGQDERSALLASAVISGSGVIEPRGRETKLAAAAAGLLTRLAVSEGDEIKKDQLLAELESTSERLALESARQDIDAARRELDKVLAGERPETIAAAKADWQALSAKAAQSSAALERMRGLAAQALITTDEFDRALKQAEQDAAATSASRSRYQALANGPRPADIALQRAKIDQAEKKLKERQGLLSLRQVLSPLSGRVLQIKYRVGEYYLPASEPLMLLGDVSQWRARIDIDERDIAKLKTGQAAYITASAFPNRRFPARVAEIGQRIGRKNIRTDDPKERIDTKILEVVLDLAPGADELVPGLRVMGIVVEGKSE
jgi:HlyD family secretion protein